MEQFTKLVDEAKDQQQVHARMHAHTHTHTHTSMHSTLLQQICVNEKACKILLESHSQSFPLNFIKSSEILHLVESK